MTKTIALISALCLYLSSTTATFATQPKQRIEQFILHAQPRKGDAYASHVASVIVKQAHHHHLSPYVVATTCYVESTFSMHSRGGLGMMQISPATYRSIYERSGLHPNRLDDNIAIGADYLARSQTRGKHHVSLDVMWGRYNGAGAHSRYVAKSRRVYKALLSSPITTHRRNAK